MTLRGSLERMLWRAWSRRWSVLSLALIPISLVYGLITSLRRRAWARRARKVPVPVVSVGNLVVGGAGKTPVALEIATRLIDRGRRVAVLSRGYGRRSSEAMVVVSDGEVVGATAAEGGDEPVWLSRRCPGLRVIVGADRAAAAQVAIDLGADLLLLDDGFSHPKLARDVDVLVVDADLAVGNGRLLPAGPLREPLDSAARAAFVWLTRSSADSPIPPALQGLPSMRSAYEPECLVDLSLTRAEPLSVLSGARVLGLCGIARPESFERALASLGANVRGMLTYPDHHPFTEGDVEEIESHAKAGECDWIVTTEKDAVRLASRVSGERYRALRMKVTLLDAAGPLHELVERFAPRAVLSEVP